MVLPTEILIKQESDDLESNPYENTVSEELPGPNYDIKLEIEVSGTDLSGEHDWLGKTEILDAESTYYPEYSREICYEDLIEYDHQECSFCGEKFCESYSLLCHNLKHLKLQLQPIDLRQNFCTLCHQHYVDKNSLKTHMELTHVIKGEDEEMHKDFKTTEMLHQCKICGKIKNYKNWHAHMKEVHGTGLFVCAVCNATFKCRSYLRKHMKKHNTKEKKVKSTICVEVTCPKCPAKLMGKSALTTHLKNCHGEQAKCDICLSVLKSRSYLNAHKKRVHFVDGKEHRCDCGKNFRSSRYLKVHIKNAHTGR